MFQTTNQEKNHEIHRTHFELHESPTFPAKTIRLGADSGTWPREAQKTERVALTVALLGWGIKE